jgi:hypothetical protein
MKAEDNPVVSLNFWQDFMLQVRNGDVKIGKEQMLRASLLSEEKSVLNLLC